MSESVCFLLIKSASVYNDIFLQNSFQKYRLPTCHNCITLNNNGWGRKYTTINLERVTNVWTCSHLDVPTADVATSSITTWDYIWNLNTYKRLYSPFLAIDDKLFFELEHFVKAHLVWKSMSFFLLKMLFYNRGCKFSVGRSVVTFCKKLTVVVLIFFPISVLLIPLQ